MDFGGGKATGMQGRWRREVDRSRGECREHFDQVKNSKSSENSELKCEKRRSSRKKDEVIGLSQGLQLKPAVDSGGDIDIAAMPEREPELKRCV